jgi:hypothetical protein
MPKVKRKGITARTKAEKADPIFAALERHKELDRIFNDVSGAKDEGRAKQRDVDRASAAAENAAWKMARTRPTTVTGASAMLSYVAIAPAVGLFDLGEMDWHETAFRTVAAALARTTGTSQRSA